MDYNVYSTDGTFPNQYGYLRIRYGANRGEYSAIFHDHLENILYTNLWRLGENKWSGWKTITTNSDVATKIYPPVTKPCENGMGNLIQQRIGDIVYCTLATYPLIYTILENVIFFKPLTYLPLYNFAIKICDEDFNEYNATVDTLGNITNTSGKNIPLGKKYTMYFSYYTI